MLSAVPIGKKTVCVGAPVTDTGMARELVKGCPDDEGCVIPCQVRMPDHAGQGAGPGVDVPGKGCVLGFYEMIEISLWDNLPSRVGQLRGRKEGTAPGERG